MPPLMRLASLCSSSSYSNVSLTPCALFLHFSQFSTSSSSSSSSNYSSSKRHDEDSKNVRVSVWWDFQNCIIPAGANVSKISHLITAAVRVNGIKGPLQITAFGDILQLSRTHQEALSASGITLNHIPQGGKNSADRSLLVDLMFWVSQNPAPAHLFLISGDKDFASILHRLRMNNYNVLLASPEGAPGVLCSAATIMWHWNALIKGESLAGRHFNQPPDGPYGSWYGHSKVPLENPFPVNDQPSFLRDDEVYELNSDPKPRPIPEKFIRQICSVLKLYPKGISGTELRLELKKSNISMDSNFYGHTKFSRLLLSMPHILKLQATGDGQFIVRLVTPKPKELLGSNRVSSDNVTGEQDSNLITKLNNDGSPTESMSEPILPSSELNAQDRPLEIQPSSELVKSIGEAMVEDSSTCPVSEQHVIEDSKRTSKLEADSNVIRSKLEADSNVIRSKLESDSNVIPSKLEADSNVITSVGQLSEAKMGFFRRIWRRLLGSKDHNSENESHQGFEKCSTSDNVSKHKSCSGRGTTYSSDNLRKAKSEGKTVKPMSQDASSMHPVSNSPDRESAKLQKVAVVSNAHDDKSSSNPGLLGSIRNWFKFGGQDAENGKVNEHCCEQNQLENQSGKHQLFSNNSFWQDMQSFMETPKAVELISRSKTRSEMVQNLLEGGPLALKSLSTSELYDFLELLISDKKWVEECPSETNPFKLTLSTARKSSCAKQPLHVAHGLRSIFMNKASQPHLQGSPDHDSDSDKKDAGISTTKTKSKSPERARSETLRDCQKLLDEILSEYPDGYNMGSFRKLFLDRYGYSLNLPKLGYAKLASLLQIMPGVTVVSNFIVPTSKVPQVSNIETTLPSDVEKKTSYVVLNSDNESSDSHKKDDNFESTWEELGPACTVSSSRNEEELTLSRKTAEVMAKVKRPKADYEPILLEYESTDSDEEPHHNTTWRSEEKAKAQTNEEESSLLQILDTWYSSKEDNSRKDNSENSDEIIDCSDNSLKTSNLATKSEADKGSFARKQRHQKVYSFVTDTDKDDDNKVKLIDGILGTLKKSSESQIHN